jgi:hypothetical protein
MQKPKKLLGKARGFQRKKKKKKLMREVEKQDLPSLSYFLLEHSHQSMYIGSLPYV